MPTDRQLAANRANAQRSTGPRTPAGKAASSANALKSGIYAKSTLIPGENPAKYDALRAEQYDQFAPATPDERDLLDLMIKYSAEAARAAEPSDKWQLRRLHQAYDQMWIHYTKDSSADDDPCATPLAAAFIRANLYSPNLINLSRIIHSTDRAFHRTRAALLKAQKDRQPPDPKPTSSKLASFPQKPEPTPIRAAKPPLTPDPRPLTPAAKPPTAVDNHSTPSLS